MAAGLMLQIPDSALAMFAGESGTMTAGIITDLHHDIMHDARMRLKAFLDAMQTGKPDCILQMGDFAYPNAENQPLADEFNAAHPLSLHVIGNHDTDANHTKEACITRWKMPARYYTKDIKGMRFVVLD